MTGALLLLVVALLGLRLIVAGLVGGDARGDTVKGLVGLVVLALAVGPCIAAVSNALNGTPGYFNNNSSGASAGGTIVIGALLGVVIVAGVLQYVRHRRSLDTGLRRPPTSRKRRVEKA